jgi:hypothetical protein
VEAAGTDPTGRVSSGQITILAFGATDEKIQGLDRTFNLLESSVGDNTSAKEVLWDSIAIRDASLEFLVVAFDSFNDQPQEEETRKTIVILGLVLLPLKSQSGVYKRVGFFRVKSFLGREALLDTFCLKLSGDNSAKVAFKDDLSLREFTII